MTMKKKWSMLKDKSCIPRLLHKNPDIVALKHWKYHLQQWTYVTEEERNNLNFGWRV